MENLFNVQYLVSSVVYSVVGLAAFLGGIWVIDKFTPGKFWHEIMDPKNVPLAMGVSALILGLAIIIASAIHG